MPTCRFIVILIIVMFSHGKTLAQCTGNVNSYPYLNNFEVNDGSWTSGGTLSDWAWGTPAKSVINSAASGIRAWMTGGLSSPVYNGGQKSWLMSPCFDLSTLNKPRVSFRIFWETERRYDGASFEYSTDGGVNWLILGNINSGDVCGNANWFNYSPVQYLNNTPGWSGTTSPTSGSCLGGNGSGGWLTATHNLDVVQGLSQVIFRFTFGAGTVCNTYDGFAVDDFEIRETPAVTTDFTYSCAENNVVNFSTDNFECLSTVSWNFDDPASGGGNTATGLDVSHQFSGPGEYDIVMTSSFTNGPDVVKTKTINILQLSPTVTSNVLCNGGTGGSASVNVTGGTGGYTYSWNTNPVQNSATVTGLSAGDYQVTVSALGACITTGTVTITEPPPLLVSTTVVSNAICAAANGSVSAAAAGGQGTFNYTWSTGSVGPLLQNVPGGMYNLNVSDGNGCTISVDNIEIPVNNNEIAVSLGRDTIVCPGAVFALNPGNFATYLWQDNSTGSVFTVTSDGTYKVEVTDNNGCIGRAEKKVTYSCGEVYFPNAISPDGNGLNETFGAMGNLAGLTDYQMKVYNRYGQVVFTTSDPYNRWDGKVKGKPHGLETFAWLCTWSKNGLLQTHKGTLTVIR